MSKSYFIPRSEYELSAWLDHFIDKATLDMGISEGGLINLKTLRETYRTKIVAADDAAALARQTASDKQACRKQVEEQIRVEARRIKAHVGYSESLGRQLGIEGAQIDNNLDNSAPGLTAQDKTGGKVVISFVKSHSDGINLYGQRENDNDWVLLGRSTQSPFIDNRPLLQTGKPELRRYTAVYMLHDQEVGNFCDDLVVSCSP